MSEDMPTGSMIRTINERRRSQDAQIAAMEAPGER